MKIFSLALILQVVFLTHISAADYGYSKSTVSQTGYTGDVQQGMQEVVVIRLSVTTIKLTSDPGCIAAVLNSIGFTVNGIPGTTELTDIVAVQLWYTGTSSSFVSPVLKATVTSPAGTMTFTPGDAYCAASTVYYWITYDVAVNATTGNLLDGSIPENGISITQNSGSATYTPTTNDPSGSRKITCASAVAPVTPVLSPLPLSTIPTLATNMSSTGVSIAVKTDGTVWGAGSDQLGEMGDGVIGNPNNTNNAWVNVTNSNIHDIRQVTLGFNTALVLRNDGTAWGWGDNWVGKIGNGSYGLMGGPAAQATPQQVLKSAGSPLTNLVRLSCGYNFSVGLTADHKVYAWGYNSAGSFGPSYTSYGYFPYAQLLTSNGSSVIDWAIDLSAGDDYLAILRWNGTIWSMGSGSFGQLGNGIVYGPGGGSTTPSAAMSASGCEPLSHIKQISAGRRFMLAVDSFGKAYGWGLNNYGQTGTGKGPDVFLPKPLLGLNCSGTLQNISQVVASGDNGYALDQSGNLYAWGSDFDGQLGNGSPPDSTCHCPKLVETGVLEVEAGLNSVLIVKSDGCVYGAGNNWYGSLGGPTPASCCGMVSEFAKTDLYPVCTVLPVELTAWGGSQADEKIQLSWSTASELNNERFEVEKQTGAEFKHIGTVQGHGTSSQIHYYGFDDDWPQAGNNFYRLRQVDFDGTSTYSPVVRIAFVSASGFQVFVYVEEFTGVAMASINSPVASDILLEQFCLNGKRIWSSVQPLQAGVNRIILPDSKTGQVCLLRCISRNEVKVVKYIY